MKKILIAFSLILLTGCTAEYRIDFKNDTFTENVIIYSPDNTSYNDILNEKYPPVKAFTYGIENLEEPIKNEGVEYYNLSAKNNNAYLDYEFNIDDFKDSYMANICYDYFRVFQEENEIVISTDKKFKCFFPGRNLDKVDIVITSNHDVLFNNADEVNEGKYIWHITEENKDDANIQISFSKEANRSAFDKAMSNYVVRILVIGGLLILLGITFGIIIRIRYKRVNKI